MTPMRQITWGPITKALQQSRRAEKDREDAGSRQRQKWFMKIEFCVETKIACFFQV
jgi:hypothetical protein